MIPMVTEETEVNPITRDDQRDQRKSALQQQLQQHDKISPSGIVQEDAGKLNKFYLSISEEVNKNARAYERPPDITDNSLVFIEEYTLETEKASGRIYLTR